MRFVINFFESPKFFLDIYVVNIVNIDNIDSFVIEKSAGFRIRDVEDSKFPGQSSCVGRRTKWD